MSDWITDNKGEGPWDFEAQKDKLGYVNNPRWVATPASDVEHEPCGYWWKERSPSDTPLATNIYVVSRNAGFWALYFDGRTLRYVGKYVQFNDNLSMVVVTLERVVLAKFDTVPTSETGIERISLTLPFTLLETTYPFLTNDLESGQVQLVCTPGGGKLFFTTISILSNLVRLNTLYEREARGYYSTVTTGTDGFLYVNTDTTGINPNWDAAWRPITGALWSFRWTKLPDMVCDSPITPWGSGTIHQGKTGVQGAYINGFLYFAHSSPVGLRRVDPSTLAILAASSSPDARGRPVGRDGKIYTIAATQVTGFTCEYIVRAFDAQSCVQLVVGPTYTANIGSQGPCGIALGSTYLIAWVLNAGGHQWKIFKIDYTTLAVLESAVLVVPEAETPDILNLIFFDSQHWIAYYYRGVGIINAANLTWKQNVDLVAQGMLTNFNPDSAFRYDIVNEPTIISQSSVDPVWTMPPTT